MVRHRGDRGLERAWRSRDDLLLAPEGEKVGRRRAPYVPGMTAVDVRPIPSPDPRPRGVCIETEAVSRVLRNGNTILSERLGHHRAGPARRRHRRQRLGQDDPAGDPGRPPRPPAQDGCCSTDGTCTPTVSSSAARSATSPRTTSSTGTCPYGRPSGTPPGSGCPDSTARLSTRGSTTPSTALGLTDRASTAVGSPERRPAQAGQHRRGAADAAPGLLPRRADVRTRSRHGPGPHGSLRALAGATARPWSSRPTALTT